MSNKNLFLAASLAAAVIAPIAGLAYLWRRPLPIINGRFKLRGLHANVEIIRDTWGVPHIYAQNDEDVFFAQGFTHAQDRLWHMEMNRRLPAGRMSELFGEIAFSTDKLMRLVGLQRAAKNDWMHASEDTVRALNAYAHGVNAFLETHANKLPLEFTILRHKPEPWRPLDTLLWVKMMAWGQGLNWDAELLRAAILDKLGPERAAKLLGSDLADTNPIILNHTPIPGFDRLVAELHDAKKFLNITAPVGMSNNWVVDGTKSATEQPLLANDPHLPLQMPSLWYEAHLVTPEWQAGGVTLPGVPLVVIGHNDNIAWGMTNAFVDAQDLYIEQFDANDPTRYRVNNGWETAQVVREEIRVKGEAQPRIADVTITRHGPVMDDWQLHAGGANQTRLALKWVGHDASRSLHAGLKLMRAKNWNDFTSALRDWTEPALSFVYADRGGNIGYHLAGNTPIRKDGKGATPVPGWNDAYEWTGWVPFDELPHSHNCTEHFYATANNCVVGKEYKHHLSLDTMNGFRAKRIIELLTAQEKLSADDFARIQTDQYCIPAETFQKLTRAFGDKIVTHSALYGRGASARDALLRLDAWDCQLTADSVPGALYEVTLYYAMQRLFRPWLGDLTDNFIGVGTHPLLHPVNSAYIDRAYLIAMRILGNEESEWMTDANGKRLTSIDVLANALGDALKYLETNIAFDMNKWQWGKLHRATLPHVLGAVKPLDKIFNRGPFPSGGDTSTVWQAAFVPQMPIPDNSISAPSWRQILDLSDWDASRGIHPTGQSGHPASRHYADMLPLWLKGKHHPLLWSREKIMQQREGILRLEVGDE